MLYCLFNRPSFSFRQYLPAIAALAMLFTTIGQAAIIDIDRIVAVVNDEIITATELQRETQAVRQQQRLQQMPLPGDDILREKVLERLVMKHIQRQAARNSGITVDDPALNATLRNIAQQNNMSLSEFHDVLERDGLDFEYFRNNIRDEITFRRLRQRHVESRIQISEQEIDDFLAEQRSRGASADEYHIAHLLIAVDEDASAKQIQQAQAQARDIIKQLQKGEDFNQLAIKFSQGQYALEGGDLGWRKSAEVPSIFTTPLVSMKTGDISPVIRSPSGFHIIKLLGHRSGERHIITQTRARHILIAPDALTNDQQAQQQLVKLKQQIQQGSEFTELAKQFSADKATATLGGRLGWVSPGEMVSEFEQAMNRLQPGQVSEPVKTQFGWHLIQVQERREHDDTESFNRNQIRQHLFSRKAEEEHMIWLRHLRSEAYVENRLEKN